MHKGWQITLVAIRTSRNRFDRASAASLVVPILSSNDDDEAKDDAEAETSLETGRPRI
jgi:hypothetical protein